MDSAGGVLVGRAAECDRIERALNSSPDVGAALVLRGPPGVGKSALLDWTVTQAADRTVLRATGSLRDMYAPFALLEALFERPVSGATEGPVDRFKVALDVFAALSALADSTRVLVVIDDTQWADDSSLDALLLAIPRLENDAVAVVFAQRDGEPCALDRVALPTLDVGGLAPDAACELLSGTVTGPVARELAHHTAGNPLALLELAESLDDNQRSGKAPLSPWLLETPTVEAGFLRRIESLAPDARRMLELASIDSEIEPGVLRALGDQLGLDAQLIAFLTEQGLIERDERAGNLFFTHPLLRTAVYRTMDPIERRDAHRNLASMLRRDDDVSRRAWHLAGACAGADEVAAAELERAAAYSLGRGAYAVAAETFERSADLTSDASLRTTRLLAAGEAYWLAGRVTRSAHTLDSALQSATNQVQRADVQIKRITTQRTRPTAEMFDELVREAEATEPFDRDRAATLFAQAVMAGLMGMQLDRTRSSAEYALELLDPADPMHFVARILHALVIDLLGNHAEATKVYREFANLFDAVGPGPHFAGIAEYTALAMLSGDDVTTAQRVLDGMIHYARGAGALGLLPLPLSAKAELSWRRGHWVAALAGATESLAIVDETDQYIERAHSLMILGKIQGGMGRGDDAREVVGRALAVADESDSAGLRFMGHSALGFVELSAGDLGAARDHLLKCREYAAGSGCRNPTLWPWPAELIEVAWLLGDESLAREMSAEFDVDAASHGSLQASALAARSRGLVALDDDEMTRAFETACNQLEDSPLRFERAHTELLFGERLLQSGRPDDAESHINRALATFDEIGAVPWSDRARSHLAPSDRHRHPTVFENLTERELQVVVAVASGKTSSEVASELFLSRRTVEHHLAAIYRKLDVRNRTQLAALVNRTASNTA